MKRSVAWIARDKDGEFNESYIFYRKPTNDDHGNGRVLWRLPNGEWWRSRCHHGLRPGEMKPLYVLDSEGE